MKVLGISTSPRVDGNSDLLLRRALEGAQAAGAATDYVRLSELEIGPCVECNACYETGTCAVEDDYQGLLAKMLEADRFIFAAPVFFMSLCAQAKMLIDRGQCLWANKYILEKAPPGSERDRRALVIAVGGSRGKKQFEGIRLTMRVYFDSLGIGYWANLFVNQVDRAGDIEKHPSAMKEAFRLGSELVTDQYGPPAKPINIELF